MKAVTAIKPALQDALDLWYDGNLAGNGYPPDDSTDTMTPYEAAEAAGMTDIEMIGDNTSAVLAWDAYKWVVIVDGYGPWAVDVAEVDQAELEVR